MSVMILALIDIVILAAWAPLAFALQSKMKAFAIAIGVLATVTFIAAFQQNLSRCNQAEDLGGVAVWGTLIALFIGPMIVSAFIDQGEHVRAIVWSFAAMALSHLIFMDMAEPVTCAGGASTAKPAIWYLATAYVLNGLSGTVLGPLAALSSELNARVGALFTGSILLVASLEMMRQIINNP